jgi:ribosomal protein L11 methyltransferase
MLGFARAGAPTVTAVADERWADAWRRHFRPTPVGRRLLIAPPWEAPSPDGRVVLVIEPGRAFGTGHHGSTAGCLAQLESVIAREHPSRGLDLGTGSGILAIAAARLGGVAMLAVDDDPDAVVAAAANAARNDVSDRVRCLLADARALAVAPVELVVANILAAAHRALAPRYRDLVAPGGTLLLGGLLDTEASALTEVMAAHGFRRRDRVSVEGWTTLELARGPA